MKYTIFKNCHYSIPPIPIFRIGGCYSQFYIVKFSEDCWYKKENDDDFDLNKLYGVSFGFNNIHKNSFRIAWRPNFKKKNIIDLYAYYYYENNNVFNAVLLTEITTVKEYHIKVFWDNNNVYEVYIDGINYFSEELFIEQSKLQFILRPYHGGNNKSKNKYNITICAK